MLKQRIDDRKIFAPYPIGKKAKIPNQPKAFFWYMLNKTANKIKRVELGKFGLFGTMVKVFKD